MATLLVPDLFYADMAILCFDPFQTSSPIFRVIWVSSAMSTLRMFGMTPFTSPCKAINRDIYICTMWCLSKGTILVPSFNYFALVFTEIILILCFYTNYCQTYDVISCLICIIQNR